MATARFYIVDVFSTTAFKGNPLAVVDDMSASLSETQMKLIARQFNLSETTFVSPPTVPTATFRLRSFLPDGQEVFGAGHNSLGAWWWLAHHGRLDFPAGADSHHFLQQLGQNVLPVEVSNSPSDDENFTISLRHQPPEFFAKHGDKAALAAALGVSDSDIGFEYAGKSLSEAQVVTTSPNRHLLVPVSSESVLDKVSFADKAELIRQLSSVNSFGSGVYVFTPSTKEVPGSLSKVPKFQARFFSPGMSGEDPATGSAAGPLAACLYENGVLDTVPGQTTKIAVLQGLRVGRTCLLELDIEDIPDSGPSFPSISVSGSGVEVASGEIVVPSLDTEF